MITKQAQFWCRHCGCQRLFLRQEYSLAMDLVLLAFTGMLWVIVLLVRPAGERSWQCATCGWRPPPRRRARPQGGPVGLLVFIGLLSLFLLLMVLAQHCDGG